MTVTRKLNEFLKDVESATAKANAADAKVVEKLKTLSAEDFARLPRPLLNNLSNRQYREIVHSIAPTVTLKREPALVHSNRSGRKHHSFSTWFPRSATAASLAIVAGLLVLIVGVGAGPMLEWWSYGKPLNRAASTAEWPRCPSLTRWTDGCVYRVVKGLDWAEAAYDLALPESYLRKLNHHIPSQVIPAQSDLIVWRARFALQTERVR
ncbi:MAG: hypothetical protein J0G33_05515 [Afipia felis]|nr:hypothetical protein [Afipia sp.]MBN9602373.1 hypothetical protein [Afipia felis]RTL61690.1 MAG: hypothetical protein EKK42_34210 [Pseudonocardiaceae bacterium]